MTTLRIPGAVDPHVHLRDMDWAHKATVEQECDRFRRRNFELETAKLESRGEGEFSIVDARATAQHSIAIGLV